MNQSNIASFIVRFHLASSVLETGEKKWRIKVTHVQAGKEATFESIDEAMRFMKQWMEVCERTI